GVVGGTRRSVTACLIDLRKTVIGPAVCWCTLEGAHEWLPRVGQAPRLQQHGSERLAHGIVPVGRLHVGQLILSRRGLLELFECSREIPLRLCNPALDHGLRKSHDFLPWNTRGL